MEKTTVYAIMAHFHCAIIQNFYFVLITEKDGRSGRGVNRQKHFSIVNYTKFLFWIIENQYAVIHVLYYIYTIYLWILFMLYGYIYHYTVI